MAQWLCQKGMVFGYHTLAKQICKKSLNAQKLHSIWNKRLSTLSSGKPGFKSKKKNKEVLGGHTDEHKAKEFMNSDHNSSETHASSSSPEITSKVVNKLCEPHSTEGTKDDTLEIKLDKEKLIELLNQESHKNQHSADVSKSGTSEASKTDSEEDKINWERCPAYYASLSKIRLTGLVVTTAMAGYAMAPLPFDIATFLAVSVGTGLTSCAANTFNQVFEVPFDSQMNRTRNRVLVRGYITPLHAFTFGLTSGVLGVSLLYGAVNGLTAVLGFSNILLYAGFYTPMKRLSIANTWIGAVVGALPPIMGWAACMNSIGLEAVLLGALLFSWQFPHFNALSWNLRADYTKAGYRMMSACNPDLCKRTSLTYSLAMVPICGLAPLVGLTTWTFAVDTIPVNGYLIYLAWKFYKEGDSQNSQRLFKYTLLHLPLVMMLMLVSKKFPTKKKTEGNS